jgi:anti-sigma B factor antagonist
MGQMAYLSFERAGAFPAPDREQAWYRLELVQGYPVVSANGEIDLATAPGLREALVFAAGYSDRIIVDLTGVTFLDSSGVRVLLEAQARSSRRGGSLSLVGPVPAVQRVLTITGLDQRFPIQPTMQDALCRTDRWPGR